MAARAVMSYMFFLVFLVLHSIKWSSNCECDPEFTYTSVLVRDELKEYNPPNLTNLNACI